MTPDDTREIRLLAPAKLNLGLAITGRRDDGFHDLVTIFQAIDLHDDLTVRHVKTGERPALVHLGVIGAAPTDIRDPGLASDDNLAVRAACMAAAQLDVTGHLTVSIQKGIPPASGMGGASSDAAAARAAVEHLAGRAIADPARLGIELALGSDVPFFRRGGTALAGSRGEDLESLSTPSGVVFVVIVPRLSTPILRKTATLFAALQPDDFDDGAAVRSQADRLRAGQPIDPALLGNGFAAPFVRVAPEIEPFRERLREVGGPGWALSGAGPTHYLVDDDWERAEATALRLTGLFRDRAVVRVCRPVTAPQGRDRVRST